ncbi:protein FAM49B [Lingula anatina]|uniref:Protein FAM49B n=1 Tax=Lingula anatina TaxID=7574 RepID=A0A1S3JJY7_LINAN|nr:protein FAM49B [Lingula anatina]|eukprot:XP_013410692.1 protein FAM49B [Lingula anatina]
MGNLLKLLSKDYTPTKVDIFVDFENAQATEHEFPLYTKVEEVLKDACHILEELQQYRGASSEIREAISNPSNDDLQEKAWEAVRPLVLQLKRYYEFSIQLENIVPQLLGKLCSNDKTAKEHLETQQALFKQFAQILDFTLKFDDLKMNNPAIQNDFSYYRRTLSRMKMTNEHSSNMDNQEVSNEIANRMSLFYAHATPMLKTLSDTTTKFVSENKDIPVENTTDCLSTMASICRVMIENPEYYTRFQNEETLLFCMRVMVGVIILYDHVHPVGAFAKNSHIDVKSSIKVLKDQHPVNLEALLNALRYTTKHLNDDATPKGTKTLLA